MPRKKASVPQRLNEDQRENQNWNLGESSSGNQGSFPEIVDLINDEVEDYESDEDVDFVPDETKPKRATKGKEQLYQLDIRARILYSNFAPFAEI